MDLSTFITRYLCPMLTLQVLLGLFLLSFTAAVSAELPPTVGPESTVVDRGAQQHETSVHGHKQPPKPPQWLEVETHVRGLPGWLDEVPVLNSNSPEIIRNDGILVSTFPQSGKRVPSAHLNLPLNGRFDVFAHHIAKPLSGSNNLYLAVVLQNPGKEPIQLKVLQAASFLDKPEAPIIRLPALAENPYGNIYAGAGDRVTDFILRGKSQPGWPKEIALAPGQSRLLFALPIPTRHLFPAVNGRSTLIKLKSSGSVYAACLTMKAKLDGTGRERAPSLPEWLNLLQNGSLATPRDLSPTLPKSTQSVIYGRVAGVARGSSWHSYIRDDAHGRARLNIPEPGKAYSYVVSTVEQGAFGTKNYHSAPLVVRYPDTAHEAHGNYGVHYELVMPLHNDQDEAQRVAVSIQCPYKSNRPGRTLLFRDPPLERTFFKGTLRLRYRDDAGISRIRYVHLVQHQADESKPLAVLTLPPGETRTFMVDFLYPPDATPPQVLTVSTLAPSEAAQANP